MVVTHRSLTIGADVCCLKIYNSLLTSLDLPNCGDIVFQNAKTSSKDSLIYLFYSAAEHILVLLMLLYKIL